MVDPTKTPEFRMSKNGVDCMIEVAPVEIVVPVLHPSRLLYVCFSHVYAMGDGADIEIAASTANGSKLLLSRRVPPLIDNDSPSVAKIRIRITAGNSTGSAPCLIQNRSSGGLDRDPRFFVQLEKTDDKSEIAQNAWKFVGRPTLSPTGLIRARTSSKLRLSTDSSVSLE